MSSVQQGTADLDSIKSLLATLSHDAVLPVKLKAVYTASSLHNPAIKLKGKYQSILVVITDGAASNPSYKDFRQRCTV